MVHSSVDPTPRTLPLKGKVSRAGESTSTPATRKLKFGHFSLAFRLGLAISFIAIASALILVYLAVRQHWSLAQTQSNAFGKTIVEQLSASLVQPIFTDDTLTVQLEINQLASKPLVSSVAVYEVDGSLIASSSVPGNASQIDVNALLAGATEADFSLALSSLPSGYFYAPVNFSGATAAYAVIAIDQSPMSAAFATSSNDLMLAVVVISAVSMLGAYILSRLLTRPVYRLLAMSDAARQGRFTGTDQRNRKVKIGSEWQGIVSVYEQLGNEIKSKNEVEKLLQQFVAADVAEQLLAGDEHLHLGESVEATVLFVDIVDFTRIAEPMHPDDVATMLNRYLSIFASCARIYRGTVDKFIGDAAMIVFGTPRRDVEHRQHALGCAAAIQLVAKQVNAKRESIGLPPVNLRIGVNSGMMRAGILGSEFRKEFTVVGDSVNLGSRLCNAADPGEILISEYVCRGIDAELNKNTIRLKNAGEIAVKGKERPVAIYELLSARLAQNWVVTNLVEDIVAQH